MHDRIGGGDGFAAGLIYGLLAGEPAQMAVNLGWAHGTLITTYPGDVTMATVEQVRAFALGGWRGFRGRAETGNKGHRD